MGVRRSELRETFAVRYLQSGGQAHALQTHLRLHDRDSLKRFQQAAGLWERRSAARRREKRSELTRQHVSIHDVCDRCSREGDAFPERGTSFRVASYLERFLHVSLDGLLIARKSEDAR